MNEPKVPQIPYCTTCKFYLIHHENQTPYEVECKADKNTQIIINPVDGSEIVTTMAVTAAQCRANPTLCGYEGKWYQDVYGGTNANDSKHP